MNPPTTDSYPVDERNRVQRLRERASYDRASVHAILDQAQICHVGVQLDGQPLVIPMSFGRDGDDLIVHGALASRLMQTLAQGVPVCVSVTLVDGLVLARSLFNHTMNYRSVVAFGRAYLIEELDAKRRALDVLTEHLMPGRSQEARPASDKELRAPSVVRITLERASAKVRQGPPSDSAADRQLAIWAGVIPLQQQAGTPLAEADNHPQAPLPQCLMPS